MIFDTDILVWALRRNRKATSLIDDTDDPRLSVVSYLELLQGARDSAEVRAIKNYLTDIGFRTIPLSENIGHRAAMYREEYALRAGLGVVDALIAATASETNMPLATGNRKHFRPIHELDIVPFRPG